MDDIAERSARLIPAVLLACVALYFLRGARRAGPRARRLANLSLFCGLTMLVLPEVMLGMSPVEWPRLFLGSGVVRMLLGLVGLGLAVAAFVSRRADKVGAGRPIAGAAFSLLHLVVGGFLLGLSPATRPAPTPWVYQSPDGAYRLTLPSRAWVQSPTTGGTRVAAF